MQTNWQHQVEVQLRHGQVRSRRDFLRTVGLGTAGVSALSWSDLLAAETSKLKQQNRACILLWMQGGPSQFETFDPKPGHANGGETKAIATNVSGIQIADSFPKLAQVANELAIVRSLSSKEGNHARATYQLHTGYIPTSTVKHPVLGATVAHEHQAAGSELPAFVRIGGRGAGLGGGYLGVEFDPFSLQDPNRLPNNTALTTDTKRYQRRLGLLQQLEGDFALTGGAQAVSDHQKLYDKAAKLVMSPQMQAFDLAQEPRAVREAYGTGAFASGCLLARRLVAAGVTFVEVNLGNWDTHQDNFNKCRELSTQVDQPFAQLLTDLKQRGMLDSTLVLWMGEFGRTPKINPNGGRDHYPRAFSAALAGGGVRGGQVIGATDAGGTEVKETPVSVADFFRSCCQSLQINADQEHMTPIGRPIKTVEGGTVIPGLFS